jgi:hypothetical protein
LGQLFIHRLKKKSDSVIKLSTIPKVATIEEKISKEG